MKFQWLMAFFILFSSHLLRAETFDVIFENAAPPWSAKDGTGYANEIVKAAFNAAHVEVNYIVQPYSRCKENVISGAAVACLSMASSDETRSSVIFSASPLFTCNADFFYNKNFPKKAARPEEIDKSSIIGGVVGYEYPPSVMELKKAGVKLSEFRSEATAFKKLADGSVQYVVFNRNNVKPVETLLQKLRLGNIAFAFHGGELKLYIGFSVKHPRGAWLKTKFDEGFKIIRSNGTFDKIEAKWVSK